MKMVFMNFIHVLNKEYTIDKEEVEKDGMDMAYHGERGFDISD
jgi:hypothetical protein